MGSLYLLKYYTYFNAGNETVKPTIGTGLKNPNADILQSQYNRSYENYHNQGFSRKRADQSAWTYTPNRYTFYSFNADMTDLIIFWACFGGLIGLVALIYCVYCSRKRWIDYKKEQEFKNRPIDHEEQERLKYKMRKMKRLRLEGKSQGEIAQIMYEDGDFDD